MRAYKNDDGPTVGAVAHLESSGNENLHCHGTSYAQQAALVIEGEAYAHAWLKRQQEGLLWFRTWLCCATQAPL